MVAVRAHLDQFGDAVVVIVTFARSERLAAYRERLQIPFPVLADVDRTLYRLFGAHRATTRKAYSIGTIRMYASLIRAGARLTRTTDDVRQLGADAIVGRDGRLTYLALPPSPDTRPPIADLIQHLG